MPNLYFLLGALVGLGAGMLLATYRASRLVHGLYTLRNWLNNSDNARTCHWFHDYHDGWCVILTSEEGGRREFQSVTLHGAVLQAAEHIANA
jgi:hypothetical protein